MEWSVPLGKQATLGDIHLTICPCCCQRDGRRYVGLALSMQHRCDVLKPCQAEVSALAQILFGELLARCEIGVPVAVTTLPGFLACRIVATLARESERGYFIEPGKPGRGVRDNPEHSSITRLVKFVGLYYGRP